MSFGIQNLGVINQKDAPAIWQSDIADFPANFIAGRILIDTFQGGIYIDTATSRKQIQASQGNVSFDNGLTNVGLSSPTAKTIGLGGQLLNNTTIDTNNKVFTIAGNFFKLAAAAGTDTIAENVSGDNNFYFATKVNPLQVITPNVTLYFYNPDTDTYYRVLAEQ